MAASTIDGEKITFSAKTWIGIIIVAWSPAAAFLKWGYTMETRVTQVENRQVMLVQESLSRLAKDIDKIDAKLAASNERITEIANEQLRRSRTVWMNDELVKQLVDEIKSLKK